MNSFYLRPVSCPIACPAALQAANQRFEREIGERIRAEEMHTGL
jgi:hypothetical protein